MAECTCTQHYAGREQPAGRFIGWAVVPTGSCIYMPGCPVHQPPIIEEDAYAFETPVSSPVIPLA